MSPKERIGYASLVGLLLFGFGYVGARHLRQPAPIVFENTTSRTHVPASKPSAATSAQPVDAQPDPEAEVVVHVAGAVKNPGVVRLKGDARVVDAIHAAGGPSGDADLDSIDMAAKLVDGTQLKVPSKAASEHRGPESHGSRVQSVPPMRIDKSGYFAPVSVAPEYQANAGGTQSTSTASAKEPATTGSTASRHSSKKTVGEVNINSASVEDLQSLPGVGAATAQKIFDYRQSHGPFKTPDELMAVKGIGQKKLDKMRPYIKL